MEYLELFHPDGYPSGRSGQRALVHRDGRLHGAAHVWVYRSTSFDTEILLQKRAAGKDTFPGYYDVSCGGHVNEHEDFLFAAIREMREELGLSVTEGELQPVCRLHEQWTECFGGETVRNNEIVMVYLCPLTEREARLDYARDEIETLEWVSASVILERKRSGDPPCCFREDELQAVLRCLSPQRDEKPETDGGLIPPDIEKQHKSYIIHITDPYSHPNASGYAGSDEWTHHEQHSFYGTLQEAVAEGKRLEEAFYDDPRDRYLYSVISWITEPGSLEPIEPN